MKPDTEDYSPTFEDFEANVAHLRSGWGPDPPLCSYPGMTEVYKRVEETLMKKPMGPPVVKTTIPPGTAMVPRKLKAKRKKPKGTSKRVPLMPSMKP